MKVKVLSLSKTELSSKELPLQFQEQVRPDLIKRAVEAIQANRRQPYGADPMAGKKCSAELSRRRRKYRGSYGHGISRVPRKIMSRRGTQMNWVGAFSPGTVGGRRAHPAKADKDWSKKINIKERRKAIRSALAATMHKEIVTERGHKVPKEYPFIIENKFEAIQKTKDVKDALLKLGLTEELERASNIKARTGVSRRRGRTRRTPSGPLLVVGSTCNLVKAGVNIPGVEVIEAANLNAELLAPGADMGRLTIFTESAIKALEEGKLFITSVRKKKTEDEKKRAKEELGKQKLASKTSGKKKPTKKLREVKVKPVKKASKKTTKSKSKPAAKPAVKKSDKKK